MTFCSPTMVFFFFFNDTATTEIYTLSLHDALPISTGALGRRTLPERSPRCLFRLRQGRPSSRCSRRALEDRGFPEKLSAVQGDHRRPLRRAGTHPTQLYPLRSPRHSRDALQALSAQF